MPSSTAVFVGGRSTLVRCAALFAERGHRLVAIASDDPPVRRWAEERGVRCVSPGRDLAAALAREPFDFLFSVAHLAVLPPDVLALPRRAAINFHDGPLPEYSGLNVTSWALLRREREHAVSWHLVTGRVDAGDVVAEVRFPIEPGDTALTLNARCHDAGVASFEELLGALERGAPAARRQDPARRHWFGRFARPLAAGLVDWASPAEEISALVRALDLGPYPNPLTTAKTAAGGTPLVVRRLEVLDARSPGEPGTVVAVGADGAAVVTTGTTDVRLGALATLLGAPLAAPDLERLGVGPGARLERLAPAEALAVGALDAEVCRHEPFWLERLARVEPYELPSAPVRSRELGREAVRELAIPARFLERFAPAPADALVAAVCAFLTRLARRDEVTLPFRHPALERLVAGGRGLFSPHVPLHLALDRASDFETYLRRARDELAELARHGTYALDVAQRHPSVGDALRAWHETTPAVVVERARSLAAAARPVDADLVVVVPDDARALAWRWREGALDGRTVARMEAQLRAFLGGLLDGPKPLGEVTLLAPEDRERLRAWNGTDAAYEADRCVHQLVEAQVRRTPGATALVHRDEALTYEELNGRANRLAQHLAARGVGPRALVGVLLDRSAEMVVALLAILKAGAAYVPLDPGYPRARLAYVAQDAGLAAVVLRTHHAALLPDVGVPLVAVDDPALDRRPAPDVAAAVEPRDLAYVIYTSGSTGKPKGVMLEHRNVVSFFAGMDARLDREPPGVWLAVTSISFDISVLELLWTLARGFTVVLHGDDDAARPDGATARPPAQGGGPIAFSLFYFASDEGERGRDKYGLLLEGARFADRHGFEAVWTPERHFHAFGGLYPNPSVASAAVAAVTERVAIRAGSCVVPLHSPIRVAEEWALVDNLSNGRVGISFASGWQPDDFAIAPAAYARRHETFAAAIDAVRALWRGERRTFPGPTGDVAVRTLPRPVQPELPFWITAAGNPETFRLAGAMGANLLTHLLGQTVEELAGKIEVYRRARREAGHDGPGRVTLMLHTFVGPDEAEVRTRVHRPLKEYLRSATNLLRQHASSFPAFRNARREQVDEAFARLSPDDLEALLEHSFARYYETSGLFGTPAGCLAMVDRVRGVGVDEIACLVDFGVPSDVVLAHLPYLDELRQRAARAERPTGDHDLPALLERHAVTHLQCTPSLASMLVRNRRAAARLGALRNVLVGGEPLPAALAEELRRLGCRRILNMYGPTETTIWSTTHEVADASPPIPIGRPIANTQAHVVDGALQPLPVGVPGELVLGGAGVARGYLHRPELTAERFVPDPFTPGGRLYRTGDLARWRDDGVLEFLGRLDHQVKIRGHRVELGEVETSLTRHPGVREAVVVAREDAGGERRLVGYVVPERGRAPAVQELREHLARELPEFMVPAAFVILDALPLTPNGKVDRNRLPAAAPARPGLESAYVAPRSESERVLARFFEQALGLERVGVQDSFVELGGDSLSAVELFSKIEQAFEVELPLATFFRVPTVAGLAAEIERARAQR